MTQNRGSNGRVCSKDGGGGNGVLGTPDARGQKKGFMGLQASSRKKSPSQKRTTIIWLGNCSTKSCVQELGNCVKSQEALRKLSPN